MATHRHTNLAIVSFFGFFLKKKKKKFAIPLSGQMPLPDLMRALLKILYPHLKQRQIQDFPGRGAKPWV